MSHTTLPERIAFIGGGNMARSLIGGLVKTMAAERIAVADPAPAGRDALARDFGVSTFADNGEAAQGAAVWVLAVKPQVLRSVAEALAPAAQRTRPLVVSVAAGITSAQIDRWLGGGQRIVRVMPNTPALLGAGASGLYATSAVDAAGRAQAETLLKASGLTAWVEDEHLIDAVTGVSGSGPAYFFLLAEAMIDAGVRQGLDPATARSLVTQTALGAARMLAESGDEAATLRQRVTSPNGTTQAALDVFECGGFRALVDAAVEAATRRGAALAAANDRAGDQPAM